MKTIITIDPGDHIGVLIANISSDAVLYQGTTLYGDNHISELWHLLEKERPQIVVFERFALRSNAAKKLVGNTFITCEVIGVVKLYCQLNNIRIVELLPSCKEYCGFSSNPKDPHYSHISMYNKEEKITEHVRDAFRLYNYYKLFVK